MRSSCRCVDRGCDEQLRRCTVPLYSHLYTLPSHLQLLQLAQRQDRALEPRGHPVGEREADRPQPVRRGQACRIRKAAWGEEQRRLENQRGLA